MPAVHVLELVLSLLTVAVLLALVARRLRIPPAAAYVVGGMVLAVIPGLPSLVLDPDLTMTLFLPPLLQSNAFFTVWRDFRANLRPILFLAIGAVAFTTLAVGWVLKLLVPELPWAASFAFGAIISPPDAVTAASVLQQLRIPRRLVTILEGESLVNDASGLVLFRFAVAAALTGSFNAGIAAVTFIYVATAGIAVGVAIGLGVVWVLRRLGDPHLEIAVSFLTAWASYIASENIGASGVLSTVACGLVLGWYQHRAFSSRTRLQAHATWAFVVFVLEALVFILIGLSLRGVLGRIGTEGALKLLPLAAEVTLAAILVRFVWIFTGTYLLRLLSRRRRARDPAPPLAFPIVAAWAGMRGVVSLAAALSLREDFPGRDLILFLTFVLILATVLIQGTTLGPLIKLLGLARLDDDGGASAMAEARAALAGAELRVIEERAQDPLFGALAHDLLAEYQDRARQVAPAATKGAVAAERAGRLELRLDALAAARGALVQLHQDGSVHDHTLRELERELDLDEVRLRALR